MGLNRLSESFEREIKKKVKSINLERKYDEHSRFTTRYDLKMSFTYIDSGTQLLWEVYFLGSNEAKKK